MKEWIVVGAFLILAVILVGFIIGDSNSLKTESQSIMTEILTELDTVQP